MPDTRSTGSPTPEWAAFNWVVLFARRKADSRQDRETEARIATWATAPLEPLPDAPPAGTTPYRVPAQPRADPLHRAPLRPDRGGGGGPAVGRLGQRPPGGAAVAHRRPGRAAPDAPAARPPRPAHRRRIHQQPRLRALEAEAGDELVDWADAPEFREAIEAHFTEVEEELAASAAGAPPPPAGIVPCPPPATPFTVGVQGALDLPIATATASRVAPTRASGGDGGPPAEPAPTERGPVRGTLGGAPILNFEEFVRELAVRWGRWKGAKTIPRGRLSIFGS